MLLFVLCSSFAVVALIFSMRGASTTVESTPIILIVTAPPTPIRSNTLNTPTALPDTESLQPAATLPSLVLEGPTLAAVVFTPTPMPITVGSTIVVEGVDLQTLNVRDRAGVTGTSILFRAEEGERFSIVEGPTQADGFTWWRIQDPLNASRSGWAVSNYLSVLSTASEQP